MAAVGMWIVGVLVVCGAVTFFLDSVRGAQLDRQQRRIEQLRAEEQRLLRAQDAGGGAPEPVCGCGHHLAQHDRRGRCHEEVSRPTGWDAEHRPTGYAPAGCTCQRYVGPQPLSQVYADALTELEPEVPDGRDRAGGDGGDDPAEGDGDGDDGGPRPEEDGPPHR